MAFKATKLVGRKSIATDKSLTKRKSGTGKAPASHSEIAGSVPKGGPRGIPQVPNSRVG